MRSLCLGLGAHELIKCRYDKGHLKNSSVVGVQDIKLLLSFSGRITAIKWLGKLSQALGLED